MRTEVYPGFYDQNAIVKSGIFSGVVMPVQKRR